MNTHRDTDKCNETVISSHASVVFITIPCERVGLIRLVFILDDWFKLWRHHVAHLSCKNHVLDAISTRRTIYTTVAVAIGESQCFKIL